MDITNNRKVCVHNFLNKCQTSMPPGLTDFLRGTIALYEYSKKYNYKFYINRSIHPIFKYFENCEYYIQDYNNDDKTFELLSQANPNYINHILEKLFQNGSNFYVITNCLLNNMFDEPISDDCKDFLHKILKPTKFIEDKLNSIIESFNVNREYNAIHIRFGDDFLCNSIVNYEIINSIDSSIKNVIETSDKRIVLITDSQLMAHELIKRNNKLIYWDNKKIHLGFLVNYDEEAIIDTLIDFHILSQSKLIYTYNISTQYQTTFSPLIAKIFNITNIRFQLKY